MIPRLQLFEITDKKWCPQSLRGTVTDYIQFGVMKWGFDLVMASLLRQVMEHLGVRDVVDLCSGSGGPWLGMLRVFEGGKRPFSVCLTDKYPNIPALHYVCRQSKGELTFCAEPVDAARVPGSLAGFRTLCSAFHHFRRSEARAIIEDAVNSGQGIAVFEITERTARTILIYAGISLIMPFCVPFLRPFRWSRLFWTYVLPVAPVVQLYDSLISCLRTYSPAELRAMAAEVPKKGYKWEAGVLTTLHSPVPVTYLLGYRHEETVKLRRTWEANFPGPIPTGDG